MPITTSDKADKPIIIIGSGRSGSTLLNFILDSHDEIEMFSETNFMIPLLHRALWKEISATVIFQKVIKLIRKRYPEFRDMIYAELINKVNLEENEYALMFEEERVRINKQINDIVCELMMVSEIKTPHWGFKELYNGTVSTNFPWSIYNEVFDKARWIHIVRHPLGFALSHISWLTGKSEISVDEVISTLHGWCLCEMKNREQKDTGRYFQIRYEDLLKEDLSSIGNMFGFLGLEIPEKCNIAMGKKYVPTKRRVELPKLSQEQLESVPHLIDLMDEYGYKYKGQTVLLSDTI